MSKVLMTIKGSSLLSNTWKQELQILEDEVYGETLVFGKRVKMHLPYENIAQVNISRGVLSAEIEIVNKGGSGNLVIKALKKKEAEMAAELIEQKRLDAQSIQKQNGVNNSFADEIEKLANLKDRKIITEDEFNAKKKEILGL
ncbi:MAG TPA: SHOCT domain-containing protein [Candidatus Paceibacterota bacterium]